MREFLDASSPTSKVSPGRLNSDQKVVKRRSPSIKEEEPPSHKEE